MAFSLIIFTFVAAGLGGVYAKAFLFSTFMCGIILTYKNINIIRKNRQHQRLLLKIILFALSYVTIVLLTIPNLGSVNINEMLSILIKLLTGPLLALVIIIQTKIGTNRIFKQIFAAFLLASILLMVSKSYSGTITGKVLGEIHSNWMGFFALTLIFISLTAAKMHAGQPVIYYFIGLPVGLATLLMSSSRGSMGALFVFFSVVALWNIGLIRSKRSKIYFLASIIFAIYMIFGFSDFLDSSFGKYLAAIVEDWTNKPLDTGRSSLWDLALGWHMQSPLIGLGVQARSEWTRLLLNGNYIDLSPHNYYLAILVETGWVGLAIVITFLYSIYSRFTELKNHNIQKYGSAFFIAVLFHQTFEVSLTTGTFTLSILIWAIFGLILTYTRRDSVAATK